MFKKLKDKIAEEVKQSPLKSVQQFAQAVVSPTSSSVFEPSSGDDKFCIEEGDIEGEDNSFQKAPTGGFTSVTLTGPSPSPARSRTTVEQDNIFPVFEPQTSNYHVQSDWESASEVEDRGHLDHVSKENLYEAYHKIFNRYNRMKSKYKELVTNYRQLDREKDKAKAILTETQDKALLRISELREQCALEQQAKAHLEEALRYELEEKDHIINSLKTKVQYLKTINESGLSEEVDNDKLQKEETNNLIDLTETTCVSKVPLPTLASVNIELLDLQLRNWNKFLLDKAAKVENLKTALEELTKIQAEIKNSNDLSLAFKAQTQVKSDSLLNVVNEFSQEVKYIQDKTKDFLLIDYKTTTHDLRHQDSLGNSVNSSISESNIDHLSLVKQDVEDVELNKLYYTVIELEAQNELLQQKMKQSEENETKISHLENILRLIKTQLIATNDLFHQGCFTIDKLDLSELTESDIFCDLNSCLTNLMNANVNLERMNHLKADLEKKLENSKNELNNLNMREDLLDLNNDLKVQLEKLQNENNERLTQYESTLLEINKMKELNETLQKQVEESNILLEASKQMCIDSNQINSNCNEEKNNLQNEISKLNVELEASSKNIYSLIKHKEYLTDEMSTLQKKHDSILKENEGLQLKIKEIQCQYTQNTDAYISIETLNSQLSKDLAALKEVIHTNMLEKSTNIENIKTLEYSINELNDNITASKKECTNLKKEIILLKESNNEFVIEQNKLVSKIKELENKIDEKEKECVLVKSSKQCISEQLSSLNKEHTDLTSDHKMLLEKIDGLVIRLDDYKRDYDMVVEYNKKLSSEIANLNEECSIVIADQQELQTKCDDLNSEVEANQSKLDKFETNMQLHEKITFFKNTLHKLRNENQELQLQAAEVKDLKSKQSVYDRDKNILQNKLVILANELENCKFNCTELSYQIISLKKSEEDMCKEKSNFEIIIENLNKSIASKDAILHSFETSMEQIRNVLNLLKKEAKYLAAEKESLVVTVLNLKEEYNNKIKESIAASQIISNEVNALKVNIEVKSKETQVFKEENTKLKQECESKQINHRLVLKENEKLVGEIDFLKKDLEAMGTSLNILKEQLKRQQEESTQQFETTQKWLERAAKAKDQRNYLLNALAANLIALNNIKQLQTELFSFVGRFKEEVSMGLKVLNCKLSTDLVGWINNAIRMYEDHDRHFLEFEWKNKKDINLYNCEIKKHHDQLQNVHKETCDGHLSSDEISDDSTSSVEMSLPGCTNSQMGFKRRTTANCKQYDVKNGNVGIPIYSVINTNGSHSTRQMNVIISEEHQLKQEFMFEEDPIKQVPSVVKEFGNDKRLLSKNSENIVDGVADVKKKNASKNEHECELVMEENNTLLKKIESLKISYEANIQQLRTEFENKLCDAGRSDKTKFILNEMKEQVENLQHDLDERVDAFETLYVEHQQLLKSKDEEVKQLRSSFERDIREQNKKWRSCLDRKLAEDETKHKEEVNKLTSTWTAYKKELEAASQLAISAVESGSNSNILLRHQVQALTLQITQLQTEMAKSSPSAHYWSIQDCTEMEYLRNILYDYMMGKEPVVLAKVLCALVKFTETQTSNIVGKEEQRLTLLGQLGML